MHSALKTAGVIGAVALGVYGLAKLFTRKPAAPNAPPKAQAAGSSIRQPTMGLIPPDLQKVLPASMQRVASNGNAQPAAPDPWAGAAVAGIGALPGLAAVGAGLATSLATAPSTPTPPLPPKSTNLDYFRGSPGYAQDPLSQDPDLATVGYNQFGQPVDMYGRPTVATNAAANDPGTQGGQFVGQPSPYDYAGGSQGSPYSDPTTRATFWQNYQSPPGAPLDASGGSIPVNDQAQFADVYAAGGIPTTE